MYGTVLHPTDGSEASRAAAERAIDLADRYDAALHVLYVVEDRALSLDVRSEAVKKALENEGKDAVDRIVERAEARGIETTGAIVTGAVSDTILDYAGTHEADVVVLGTHGRSGLDRLLLGSVAERVVRNADVPVLTVPPGDVNPEED